MKLLTVSNPKTMKGRSRGWSTAILHLAPATVSGWNVCPDSTESCRAVCLNTAGRGGIPQKGFGPFLNHIQAARVRKTKQFFLDRNGFMADLINDIRTHRNWAKKLGFKPAVRLNGTSDLPWESIRTGGMTILEMFPDVKFYDYTKSWSRAIMQPYHLTFSRSESTSDADVQRLIDSKVNVAVVFAGTIPKTYNGCPVVNGDNTDLRFLDKQGVVVGLKAKGKAKKEEKGFVVR